MQLDKLLTFFSGSPAAQLLRARHAPFVIDFLYRTFKEGRQLTWPHSDLLAQLAIYQEQTWESHPDVLRDQPEVYLTSWCTGQTRWLRRFLEADTNEPSYELTPHTEDVFKFLGEVLDKTIGFVGTESRLRRILQSLSDLVIGSSDDPQQRLEHLYRERDRIDAEIAQIEQEGIVSTYSPTAIRERFAEIVTDLTQLQGDFRAVEESFKSITRDVQKRHVQAKGTRGDILGYALDSEESLKNQDQGISFDEFVRLVLSPTQQDELEQLITRLDQIEELVDQAEGLSRMRDMVPSLLAEAQKVLRTTQRLSMTLRRLLDARSSAGRRRLANCLRELRTLAITLSDKSARPDIGLRVETELPLGSAMERTFWSPPARFDATEMKSDEPDEDDRMAAFRSLAAMRRLDWTGMRRGLHHMLRGRDSLPLSEYLAVNPPAGGVVEVLGYVQIAHDDGHEVDAARTETVVVPTDRFDDSGRAGQVELEIPAVTYRATRRSAAPNQTNTTDEESP